MDELKGFVPVLIGLAVICGIVVVIAGAVSWLASNPVALILALAAVGGVVYFWIKRHRARTMV